MLRNIIIILFVIIVFKYLFIENLDNTFFLNNKEKKCCLVKKMVDINGFYYHYILSDCNNDLEKNLNSERLLTGKQYPLSLCNYYYSKNKKFPKKLGSCRNVNHECIDFVNKKTCNKYGMRWEPVPCNTPIIYKNKMKMYKIGKYSI